jgi:hypothetical protein
MKTGERSDTDIVASSAVLILTALHHYYGSIV